jgi:folate-dependent phosphoribosylglycinamide formyltransferase PurN
VWNDFVTTKPSVLHAYDGANVSRELYNSEQNAARDRAGVTVRFTIPTVANGRVYVGAKREVSVYGLLAK